MNTTKITLTPFEREKLLVCIDFVAKDFEIKRYKVETVLNEIEKDGSRDKRLLTLLEHYVAGQEFYEGIERKIKLAFENNQL